MGMAQGKVKTVVIKHAVYRWADVGSASGKATFSTPNRACGPLLSRRPPDEALIRVAVILLKYDEVGHKQSCKGKENTKAMRL
jgi:hypothetical protein